MSYDLPTLTFIAVALSAIGSAASALASWRNTSTFVRQLRNTTVDECLIAAFALKAAVHKTIEHRANKVDNITPERIQDAYDDAWPKWVGFHQAFRVAQRYNKGLQDQDFNAPDKTSELLSQLRISLRDPSWTPGGDNDPRDIRYAVNQIVDEIQKRVGLAEG